METDVWGKVLAELRELYPTHACKEFLELFDEYNFQEDNIAQLQDVSEKIRCAPFLDSLEGHQIPRQIRNLTDF